jgi:hypothetical protein
MQITYTSNPLMSLVKTLEECPYVFIETQYLLIKMLVLTDPNRSVSFPSKELAEVFSGATGPWPGRQPSDSFRTAMVGLQEHTDIVLHDGRDMIDAYYRVNPKYIWPELNDDKRTLEEIIKYFGAWAKVSYLYISKMIKKNSSKITSTAIEEIATDAIREMDGSMGEKQEIFARLQKLAYDTAIAVAGAGIWELITYSYQHILSLGGTAESDIVRQTERVRTRLIAGMDQNIRKDFEEDDFLNRVRVKFFRRVRSSLFRDPVLKEYYRNILAEQKGMSFVNKREFLRFDLNAVTEKIILRLVDASVGKSNERLS